MPFLDPATVVVAYDIVDDERREVVAEYLKRNLMALRRTDSVYEFVFGPPATPSYERIVKKLFSLIEPEEGDQVFMWDLENGRFRRLAVHKLSS